MLSAGTSPKANPMAPFAPNTEGIWFNLPAAVYHAAPGFSQSQANHITPPARLLQYWDKPDEETEYTRMGSLVHQSILEPEVPLPGFAIIPEQFPAPADHAQVKSKKVNVGDLVDWNWNAKYCQKWREKQEAEGLEVIAQKELDRLAGIILAVKGHDTAAQILARGHGEVSCFWYRETQFGRVLCKTRLDWVTDRRNTALADIKVVQEGKAETEEFTRLAIDRGYHLQAAANLEGWNRFARRNTKDKFVFIAVEREQPMSQFVNCVAVPENVLEAGRQAWRSAVETYARCVKENRWPGYGTGINTMILKRWDKERLGI